MRKRRSDATPLDPHQAQLDHWLFVENLGYEAALERLRSELGLRCSRTALWAWTQRRMQERALEGIAARARVSREITGAAKAQGLQAYEALFELIGDAAFEMKLRGTDLSLESLKDLAQLASAGLKAKQAAAVLEQRDRELALKERRFKLLEERESKAKAAVNDASLTPEQQAARIREIFGLRE